MRTVGFDRPLYILPFDHWGSFQTKMFGWTGELTAEQTAKIAAAKRVIYDGLLAALAAGVPRAVAGILVNEQFGAAILRDARAQGILTACPAEKSGQDEFDFEYESFAAHIEAFRPTFCKALVRCNPGGDAGSNRRQAVRLRRLSDYLRRSSETLFMFELLVPPAKAQLGSLGGDRSEDCRKIVAAARGGGRDRVGCIVLGRGEDDRKVHEWLTTAAGVRGFIGFAVGRTTFWEPVVKYVAKKMTREAAVTEIARRYLEFVGIFEKAPSS